MPTSLVESPSCIAAAVATLSDSDRTVLDLTKKMLFVTEYIVLIEYTEVIMPIVYSTLVLATYTLPNREYYTFLEGICSHAALAQLLTNVLLYTALEFVSLITIALIVWRELRLSLLHQLAFVLEQRAANIQAKMLLWVLEIIQTSIAQLGSDYSFQFAWLRKDPLGQEVSSTHGGC